MKFSSGIAGKLLFVSIGEQKLRDSGAKRRGVLEPVSKRESRFENTLEEASFLLLFFTHVSNIKLFGVRESTIWRGKKRKRTKMIVAIVLLTTHHSSFSNHKSQFSKNK